jgi:hypothetical protein
VLALSALALAIYVGRPEELATTGLLVGDASLVNSTVIVVAETPPPGSGPLEATWQPVLLPMSVTRTAAGIRRALILDLRCCSLMMACWW